MESHNNQKKIAAIHDLTGFGRCALTVVLPVISVMGVACCPVPTSILSNHTAFDSCFFDDYTDKLGAYLAEWKKLQLTFSGIYSGFLASEKQIDLTIRMIADFADARTKVLVDPVMADHGRLYKTYTTQMCAGMKRLVRQATLITPNLTEACILADEPYRSSWREEELKVLAGQLLRLGPEQVVITGIEIGEDVIANYCMDGSGGRLITTKRVGRSRCGTGDLFAAILAADAVNGVTLDMSVSRAACFVEKTMRASDEMEIPVTDGVCFEEFLGELAI